ncbi:MAG: hypothetical protein GXO88_07025 [Chlorobi bacterium]|nr:hypothetical protein [Chlorobiota bacterium]
MKTDKLEQFVLENRSGFDDQEPPVDLWPKIEKDLAPERTTIGFAKILWRVAAVIIIFVSSYYFHDLMDNSKADNAGLAHEQQTESYKSLVEAEMYYSSEIKFKKQELFQLTANTPLLQKNINAELSNLDDIFMKLKEDLNDNADNDEVVEAMIQNYRIKLDILEEMLQQIKVNNAKNNNHDKIHNAI